MFGDITYPRSSNTMLNEFHGSFTVRWNASSPEHHLKHGPPVPSISDIVMALTVLHAQPFKVVGRPYRPPVTDGHAKVGTMHASESSSKQASAFGRDSPHSAKRLSARWLPVSLAGPWLADFAWALNSAHRSLESLQIVAHSAFEAPSAFRGGEADFNRLDYADGIVGDSRKRFTEVEVARVLNESGNCRMTLF